MASTTSLPARVLDPASAKAARPDTLGLTEAQGRPRARSLPVRTLVALRSVYIGSQLVILGVVWLVLRWPFPAIPCLLLVAVSAGANLALAATSATQREARPAETLGFLAFDVLELSILLHLIGGVVNPFAFLLIAPVTVAGGALPARMAVLLCVFAVTACLVLTFYTMPPPWLRAQGLASWMGYRSGRSVALVIAMVFAGAYASWASREAAKRELALHLTEAVLAREQRLSALGALSAAVAHELGTPLATITIIASEMAREAPEGPFRDDAVLMLEQARRCRDILKQLTQAPERPDALHERMSLLQLVREIVEPYAARPGAGTGAGEVRVEALVTGPPGVSSPDVWRRPEVLHAVSTLVENAYDFARSEILLTARFDRETIALEVRDDGPGFSAAILPRLGDPYVTSRPGAEGSRTGHVGMGLGIFIAKTLLERSGAEVSFANSPGGGALAAARWPRARMEIRSETG